MAKLIATVAVIGMTGLFLGGLGLLAQWLTWHGPEWLMDPGADRRALGSGVAFSLLMPGFGAVISAVAALVHIWDGKRH